MQLLKKISLQAETVTFSSALACHSNTNVSNSPAGSKLSQVMFLEHHPDEGTGSFYHHCWEPSRTAPAPLHPYSRSRKVSCTGQTSLSYIFPQAAMKRKKGENKQTNKPAKQKNQHKKNPKQKKPRNNKQKTNQKKPPTKHQKAQNHFCASHRVGSAVACVPCS